MLKAAATIIPLLLSMALLHSAESEIKFVDVTQALGGAMQPRAKHPNKAIAENQANFQNVYEKGYFWNVSDVCFADVNGDGALDIFMLNSPHGLWSRLWLGDGKGVFVEVPATRLNAAMHSPASWHLLPFDFLGKGAQDIVITQPRHGWDYKEYTTERLRCATGQERDPEKFRFGRSSTGTTGATHLLSDFDNDGFISVATGPDFGRDTDPNRGMLLGCTLENDEIVLDRTEIPIGVGSGSVAADFVGDGHVSVLARGFWTTTKFIRNVGRRHFVDATSGSGLENMPPGGPIAVADFNNDGLLDIYCSGCGPKDSSGGPHLYINQGNGKFKDCTEGSGLIPEGKKDFKEQMGMACVADFDNDGLLDICVCDGDDIRVFKNLGGGKFQDVTKSSGLPLKVLKESNNCVGDFDADGRVDLLLITASQGIGLFHNETQTSNGWLKVKLEGPRGNPEGAGAQVTIFSEGKMGAKTALLGYQEKIVSTDFRMANPLHFGLNANKKCDVRTLFPDGKVVEIRSVSSGTTVVVHHD